MKAFARGFSSILGVYGLQKKEDLSFEYNGRDLTSLSVGEALSLDWISIAGIEFNIDQDDERRSETA